MAGEVLTSDEAFAVLSGTYDGQNVHTVGDAGDVNGDGTDDVVIGAPRGGPYEEGEAFIVFGPVIGDIALDTVAQSGGTPGIKINGRGSSTLQRGAGTAVTTAGDTNGDGFDDVMVSEPGTARPEIGTGVSGRVYIILGGVGSRTVNLSDIATGATSDGYLLDGAPDDELGRQHRALDAAGDANNDGYDDVIIGAPGSPRSGAYLVFGSPAAASIDLNEAQASADNRAVFMSLNEGATNAGGAVAGIGDVNGDGLDDVAVGASGAKSLDPTFTTKYEVVTGAVFIVYGKTDGVAVDLGSLGSAGVELNGKRTNGLGWDVAGLDDLNGDGVPEFAAVDRDYFVEWADEIGRVIIYDGASKSGLSSYTGESEYRIGAVTEAGDTDGDGRGDVVVTRIPDFDASLPRIHHVLLEPLSGGALGSDSAWQIEFPTRHDDIAGVGDLSNNGVADLLAGDISASEGGTAAGAAYLFQGQERGPELPSEGPVSVTVTRVSSADSDGDDTPVDMYVEATFGPDTEVLDTEADRTVDTADAEPNWRLTSYQPYDASDVSLRIALLDDDGAVDEVLDLDAAVDDDTLDLVIDRTTGVWGGDLVYPERCVTGPKAELCFDLDNLDQADVDIDADGISDREELSGELASLGADPCRKTIAIEIDHMVSAPPAVTATDMVVEAFDVAPVPAVTDCPYPGFPRSPSGIDLIVSVDEELPDTATITTEEIIALRDDAGHLAPFRRPWWHWGLYAGSIARENSGGFCCLGRWDFVSVTLVANGDTVLQEGVTLMHELGHALGLGHGGSDRVNHKPNYISIMNYQFALSGLTRASDGSAVIDYSRWNLPDLNETDLSQPITLGETGYLTSWHVINNEFWWRAGDTNSPIHWLPDEDPATGIVGDVTREGICVEQGPDLRLDTEAVAGDDMGFSTIRSGDDRDCDTTAHRDDEQVISTDHVQADVLTSQNDWENLHFRGALSGDTSLGGFDPDHVDPDPASMSDIIEFWQHVRNDPGNVEPEAVDDTYGTPSDTALTIGAPGVLDNDTDGDSDPLTASPLTQPSSGTLSVSPDGSFDYVPDPLFVGTDSFEYLADDGDAGTAVATVTIRVTSEAGNGTPVADDDAYVTDEDAPLSVDQPGVLDNDTDPDDDPLTARVLTMPSLGTVALADDGGFVYTPDADVSGADAFTYEACDRDGACDDATVSVTMTAVNDGPTAVDDEATTEEDTPVHLDVRGNDHDVEGDPLTVTVTTPPTDGTAIVNADHTVTYIPDPDTAGADSFTYTLSDGTLTDTATVSLTVTPVNDAPVVTSVSPTGQRVDHSDALVPVTVTAGDVDGDTLTLAISGLPAGVTASSADCTSLADGASECTWTLSGVVTSPAGVSIGTAAVSDAQLSDDANVVVTVEAEDATVTPDDANPVAVQVAEAGGDSGAFALSATLAELVPDQASGVAAAGDLSTAVLSMTLTPVGPGSTVGPLICTNATMEGTGYDQELAASCAFSDVPVNTYTVEITVDGVYWAGAAEGVLTVSDPSLGSATGGGTFYWPGTADPDSGYLGDRTNFGFTMSYNKRGTNLRGSLLVIRHLPDGTKYRVKSNALDGLALGEDPAAPMGWASFSGKATYLQPGWDEPQGNHAFTVYVEDRDEPGTGTDRFWLQTRDKAGDPIDSFSLAAEATENAEPLAGGNIVVPHAKGK